MINGREFTISILLLLLIFILPISAAFAAAPVGVADSYQAVVNNTLTVAVAEGVLVNDSDGEGRPMMATLVTDVSNGSLTLNADGSFSYVPDSNYVGTDSFTYSVFAGSVDTGGENSAPVLVEIEVLPKAMIGARISVIADGSPPFEDYGTPGVHDSGDDIDDENGIVRTMDRVTYLLEVSVNGETGTEAENMVVRASLTEQGTVGPGEEVWDMSSPVVQSQMDAVCGGPGGWSLESDDTVFVCDMGTVAAPRTENFTLFAYVNLKALDGKKFDATIQATAYNGIPNPDVKECIPVPAGTELPNGCWQTAEDTLTVSAHLSMETVKRGPPAHWTRDNAINYPHFAIYDHTAGYRIRYYVTMRYGADGDYRGASIPNESTIPILSDSFKIWDYADPTRTPLANGTTLVGCGNVRYGNLLNYANPTPTQESYSVTQADWDCQQAAAGGPITVAITNADFEREPPTEDYFHTELADWLKGTIALGYVDLFIPLADIEKGSNREIGIENCFAIDPGTDGEPSTGVDEFRPLDTGGGANNNGDPEDLSNNCWRSRVHAVTYAAPGPSFYTHKYYRPCYGDPICYRKIMADNIEFYALLYLGNTRISPALPLPPSPPITDAVTCDKFDNRTQFLRAEGFIYDVTNSNTADTTDYQVSFEYGVGDWGMQSGIAYDQTADWDSTWYQQATATCEDSSLTADYRGMGQRWFSAAEIDWDNLNTPGMVNAEDVNFVRIKSLQDLPSTDIRIYMEIPLQAKDNDAGDYLVNYKTAKWGSGNYSWLACNGMDTANERCPNPPILSQWAPGSLHHSDHYLHVENPVDIIKRLDLTAHPGRLVKGGGLANWALEIDTRLPAEFPAFPSGTEVYLDDVVIWDELNPLLSYVPGSAKWNGQPYPDPVITYNPNQVLTWDVGDLLVEDTNPVLTFQTQLSSLVVAGQNIWNYAHVDSSDDPRPEYCHHYISYATKCHGDYLTTISSAAAAVEKTTKTPAFGPGDDFQFEVTFARLSNFDIDWVDLVDILPYNGDSRGSDFDGPLVLTGITEGNGAYPGPVDPYTIWASAVAPQTLDTRNGSEAGDDYLAPATAYGGDGQGLGGADWPCLLSDVLGGSCAEIAGAAQITAIRIYAPKPTDNAVLAVGKGPYGFTMHFNTDQASPHDYYGNSFGGNFHQLALGVFDNSGAEVQTFALGDIVFEDLNDDGVYTPGTDRPMAEIVMNLLDENGDPVMKDGLPVQTTTNAEGRYIFLELMQNTYMVEVDPSNFRPYQPLECRMIAGESIADDNSFVDDEDEEFDHNATDLMPNGAVRSRPVVMYMGTEPLNDDKTAGSLVPAEYADGNTNLTVDFGFVMREDCTPSIPDLPTPPDVLPDTGFLPGMVGPLPSQSAEKAYSDLGELWLEIPSLGVSEAITGVPISDENGWDTMWLNNEVGYLVGTAFPATVGNTVLTGHNILPNGNRGPFADLAKMNVGDTILLHAYGSVYRYEIQETLQVRSYDQNVLKHSDYDLLTLMTCEGWNGTAHYPFRRVVHAVLMSVTGE